MRAPIAWFALASVVTVLAIGMAAPDLVAQLQPAQGVAEGAGAFACLLVARHAAGRARVVWSLFTAGLVIWAATDIAFGVSVALGWDAPDAVTMFDAFWLLFYVPMLLAVALIYTGLRTERGWQGLLDAALVALSVTVFAWVSLIGPVAADSSANLTTAAVNALYPAFDLAAIVSLGWLMIRLGPDSPLWLRLVTVAFVTQVTADLSYVAGSFAGPRVEVLSGACFTAAGWLWVLAATVRLRAPERLWRGSPHSVPPVWSQVIPVVCGLALVGLVFTAPGPAIGVAVFCGVLIMVARLIATLSVDRQLMAERGEVSEMRATLLLQEQAARRTADQARAALALQNERLTEVDRMKDEFVAMVSHEFRTPLTSIRGYLEAVLDGEVGALEPEQERFLTVVQRNTFRLARLVEDLLLFARIQEGRMTLAVDAVALHEVVAESVESARPVAQQASVDLRTSADVPVVGQWDRGRVAQALDNLISNAIKFTPEGGHVGVTLHEAGGAAVIEVSDTGPGIAPDELAGLFTPFYRTRHATANAVPGTGLGLAISKAIVELHGGTIDVRSEVGEGTAFRIALPVEKAISAELPRRALTPAS